MENEWEAWDIAGCMGGEASVHGGGGGGETKRTRAATVSEAIGSLSQRRERGREILWQTNCKYCSLSVQVVLLH